MKTDTKQGESKFTEKDLTPKKHVCIYSRKDDRIPRLCAICGHPEKGPLETHVQSELEKIQAGHEGYKVVPVELWEELIKFSPIAFEQALSDNKIVRYRGSFHSVVRSYHKLITDKLKSL